MMKKIGVLEFPGSHCANDVLKALKFCHPELLPGKQSIEIKKYKAFVVPGGFSYGDYLRAGALAAFCPAMKDLIKAAHKGWPVLGICNGFQILCEAGLLEGVLLPNKQGRFIDEWSTLQVKNKSNFWPVEGQIQFPIAHGEGRYYLKPPLLKKLQDKDQIWICYKNNPNGSLLDIAGVMNEHGNVAGLMPHPERATAAWMGGEDGQAMFKHLGKFS